MHAFSHTCHSNTAIELSEWHFLLMTSKPLLTFALGTLSNATLTYVCVLLCYVLHVFPSTQVSHMDCPESKNFVRGDVKIGGYVIRDNPSNPQQSAIVTYVTQVDLKGGWGRMDEGGAAT